MNRRSQRQMKLIDSHVHGHNSELFIVEGESAASSVSALCDHHFQAVLPLQGKPLNAYKATEDKVLACPLYYQFAQALGLSNATQITDKENQNLNFGKIFLLFDPDADGIHIGALMLLYIKRWLPALLHTKKIGLVRAPMFLLVNQLADGSEENHYAYLPEQLGMIKNNLTQKNQQTGGKIKRIDRFQSLGSVPSGLLENLCINPVSRKVTMVETAHVDAVVTMFGA